MEQWHNSNKLFLTFSNEDTLSYSTIIENIMVMMYIDDSGDILSYKEAKEALNGLSKDDYDEIHSNAVSAYSAIDMQNYLDRTGIHTGMRLDSLDNEDAEGFMEDVESLSWTGFTSWELPDSGWE